MLEYEILSDGFFEGFLKTLSVGLGKSRDHPAIVTATCLLDHGYDRMNVAEGGRVSLKWIGRRRREWMRLTTQQALQREVCL